jgi:hypothetical protein
MSAAVVILAGRLGGGTDPNRDINNAKKLSTDKEPEHVCGFWIIYANGTRWALHNWCGYELYWIPDNDFYKQFSIEEIIKRLDPNHAEYRATWFRESKMVADCKWIINCHPNLTAKGWYWRFRKTFNI